MTSLIYKASKVSSPLTHQQARWLSQEPFYTYPGFELMTGLLTDSVHTCDLHHGSRQCHSPHAFVDAWTNASARYRLECKDTCSLHVSV